MFKAMYRCVVAAFGMVTLSTFVAAAAGNPTNLKIVIDPDIRISWDGDNVMHMEAPITASATDPNALFAAAEVIPPGRFDPSVLMQSDAQIYYSHDGGAQWHLVPMPEAANGTWDNAIAGGSNGKAYFITHAINSQIKSLVAYRTEDNGVTWSSSPIAGSWDREYVGVDNTQGQYAGRVYVAGTWTRGGAVAVDVTSSSDGAKTFDPPVHACSGPSAQWGAMSDTSPMVLGDGTLVVPCNIALWDEVRLPNSKGFTKRIGVVVSTDGGKTFSPFHLIGYDREVNAEYFPRLAKGNTMVEWPINLAAFAAAPKTGAFPDRLYAVWAGFATDRRVLYFSSSADRGVTWSKPIVVNTYDGKATQADYPMLSVNKDGVVGVAWFDGRNSSGGSGYDVYFTVSDDGGKSFLPSVRVSSSTSYPARGTNVLPLLFSPPAGGMLYFRSQYLSRPLGGDYSTMTADAAGRFHILWPDARGTAWQLYTSTIHVLRASEFAEMTKASFGRCALGDKIGILPGVPLWDAAKGEVSIPVRLENLSHEPLFGPLRAQITMPPNFTDMSRYVQVAFPAPRVFDETSKRYGSVGYVTYTMEDGGPLLPDSVTREALWRFRADKNPNVQAYQAMSFFLKTAVTGAARSCQ